MAATNPIDASEDTQDLNTLQGGTYEILKRRLAEHGKILREKAEKLNRLRKEIFGGQETALIGSTRLQTEYACTPREIHHIGEKLIIGYDVFLGMKKEIEVCDVFNIYAFEGEDFKNLGIDFLDQPDFVRDFKELYRYYREARLLHMRNIGTHLLLVFQIGTEHTNFKVFRWQIERNGEVKYIDNRGEREYTFPAQHDFKWTRTTRDMQVSGRFPHYSIDDEIFVECTGGDLTIKVENNTESGQGIFAEEVDNREQALDDAEYYYAILQNLILLRIKPFGEQHYRHIVYNRLQQTAKRIDAIGQSCIQLPEGHGIVFPGGYYLQSGECKQFNENIAGMEYLTSIKSGNGEDVLYVFHHRKDGRYILLQYNMIEKNISTPLLCNGFSLYANGLMVIFRQTTLEASKSHPVQIWRTPFTSEDRQPPVKADSYVAKIGNRDLVNGISDALSLAKFSQIEEATLLGYQDLIRQIDRIMDRYHWLPSSECLKLGEVIKKLREAATGVVDEYEKVVAIRKSTSQKIETFETELEELYTRLTPDALTTLDALVGGLAQLRDRRGQLISMREMRYALLDKLKAMEAKLVERYDLISECTVKYLLSPNALADYQLRLQTLNEQIGAIDRVTAANPLEEQCEALSTGLDLLTEMINGLQINDATQRTDILEALTEVYGQLNRTKAQLVARKKDLHGREAVAEFGAQFKLLSQSVSNYIGMCDAIEKCDELLTRTMVQLEELEAKFSDFPEYIEQLIAKRDEIYDAFSARKQQLLDERQRRSGGAYAAAERILSGVQRRAQSFKTIDELNAYYASDPMILKFRELIAQLRSLGDSVKADDAEARLKASSEDAGRMLRDKLEIYEDGTNIIKLGERRFSVNTQPLDLSLVMREERLCFHITGTDYYQPIDDQTFEDTRMYWDRALPSESRTVYRVEYLAYRMLCDAEQNRSELSIELLERQMGSDKGMVDIIRKYIANRYDEGYERGVHDHDCALLLSALLQLRTQSQLLRFDPSTRAFACLFWYYLPQGSARKLIETKAHNLGQMQKMFVRGGNASEIFLHQIAAEMKLFFAQAGLVNEHLDLARCANYLFRELSQEHSAGFACSQEAEQLATTFLQQLSQRGLASQFEQDLRGLESDPGNAFDLAATWLKAYLAETAQNVDDASYLDEGIALLLTKGLKRAPVSARIVATVEGLLGQHPRIESGTMNVRFDEFLLRLQRFDSIDVPGYRTYLERRKGLMENERERLRLDEFKPKPMSSFVRNKLINEVYLKMIGDNLAKQIGEAGASRRTDLMGMLLLISPPGYGKTTLMEYVSSRLGLTFMKINGPALGHSVISLDPNEAPNATARQEVEKTNLALEMGNNVMLYIDDIQHTNSEFLQKFISLCDAQRKIEGVFNGRTRTYDLRGKKVVVVMAGNPYTETGVKFQVPDMLANRADTYNLGDIIGGRQDLFELSYLENCLTANPILAPLANRDLKDFYHFVRVADGEEVGETEFSHDYSASEQSDIVATIKRMRTIQRVVLRVNMEYIASAAMDDKYRTEPTFKLQGSYRDMTKMVVKVLPVMSEDELEQVIQDHYRSEAQNLTSAAEHNLLKLAEIRNQMTEVQRQRWSEIKSAFKRHQSLAGADSNDRAAQIVAQMASFNENLERIKETLALALTKKDEPDIKEKLSALMAETLQQFGLLLQQRNEDRESIQHRRFEQVLKEVQASMLQLGEQVMQPAPPPEQPKVEIINTLPQYYANLYKHHLDVIEGTLVPMIQAMNTVIGDNGQIHEVIVDVQKQLKRLLHVHKEKRHTQGFSQIQE